MTTEKLLIRYVLRKIYIEFFYFCLILLLFFQDHAPEILFSEEYYPTLVEFMRNQQAILSHFKFSFCATVIYESPICTEQNAKKKNEDEKKDESFRKG